VIVIAGEVASDLIELSRILFDKDEVKKLHPKAEPNLLTTMAEDEHKDFVDYAPFSYVPYEPTYRPCDQCGSPTCSGSGKCTACD
jgi:hypothetical protein